MRCNTRPLTRVGSPEYRFSARLMEFNPRQDAFVLTGPTGSGKSALGIELARAMNAEIVSMDSMSLYRGMDIGTAKPTSKERQQVPHHLIDVLDPCENATVAWWLAQATACAQQILDAGKRVLFVGGTPLYLKALFYGLFEGPGKDAGFRAGLEAIDPGAIHARLAEIDPATAARLHPNDARRIIRALEVYEITGKPISDWQTQWKAAEPEPNENRVLWLDLPRAELYERINARVDRMVADGLIEEVDRLRQAPRGPGNTASQALGYKEILKYLNGRLQLDAAIDRIKIRSRQFAKRQVTWFRHLPVCKPATRELTFELWGSTMNG